MAKEHKIRACRKCGCTEDDACIDSHGHSCYWVEYDLCSECLTHVDDLKDKEKTPQPELTINQEKPSNKNMKKIVIPIPELKAVLSLVKDVAENASPLSTIAGNILMKVADKSIKIIATNLEVTIIADIEVTNMGESGYEYLLPFEYLHKVCAVTADSAITFEFTSFVKKVDGKKVTTDKATITTFTDVYNIDSLESSEAWPVLPEFPHENSIGIGDGFIECMNAALITVVDDKVSSAMQKLLIEISPKEITIVSTNMYVLYKKSFAYLSDHSAKLLVSKKIAHALNGFEETTISWSTHHVAFVSKHVTLIGTLQDEKFPAYKALIPNSDTNLIITHAELKGMMEKIMINKSDENTPSATFYLKREIGCIIAENFDPGLNRKITSRAAIDYTGDCVQITVDPKQMLKLLKQIKYLTLNLSIAAGNQAVLVEADSDDSYKAIIMPIANKS